MKDIEKEIYDKLNQHDSTGEFKEYKSLIKKRKRKRIIKTVLSVVLCIILAPIVICVGIYRAFTKKEI